MEADPDLIKEVHGMDIEDLRGHEKRMMQHNRCRPFSCFGILNVCRMLRDPAAATRGKASSYDHGQRGYKGKRDVARRDYPRQRDGQRDGYNTDQYNAYRKPKQAGGDRKSYSCYECNEVGHRSFECPRKGAGKKGAKKG